jgi:hypothetical protein
MYESGVQGVGDIKYVGIQVMQREWDQTERSEDGPIGSGTEGDRGTGSDVKRKLER